MRAIEDLARPALEILQATRPATRLTGELAIIRGVLSPVGLIAQALGEPGVTDQRTVPTGVAVTTRFWS